LAAAAGGGGFDGELGGELDGELGGELGGGSGEEGCSRLQAGNPAKKSNSSDARATIDPVVEVVRME
jgi:hypothetical protein